MVKIEITSKETSDEYHLDSIKSSLQELRNKEVYSKYPENLFFKVKINLSKELSTMDQVSEADYQKKSLPNRLASIVQEIMSGQCYGRSFNLYVGSKKITEVFSSNKGLYFIIYNPEEIELCKNNPVYIFDEGIKLKTLSQEKKDSYCVGYFPALQLADLGVPLANF